MPLFCSVHKKKDHIDLIHKDTGRLVKDAQKPLALPMARAADSLEAAARHEDDAVRARLDDEAVRVGGRSPQDSEANRWRQGVAAEGPR